MNNSGAQIHLVSPSESGPPMAKPMNPAACARPTGVSGEPAHRCHRPSAGSATIAAPSTSRGRASGFGSVRINSTATAAVTTGSSHHRRADEDAQHRVDPCADRAGGVEPGTGGDDDGDTQQRQSNPVATMARIDLAGPAHRPRRAAGSLGQHQPRRTHGATTRQPRVGHQRVVTTPGGPARSLSGPSRRVTPGLRRPRSSSLTCSFGLRSARQSC